MLNSVCNCIYSFAYVKAFKLLLYEQFFSVNIYFRHNNYSIRYLQISIIIRQNAAQFALIARENLTAALRSKNPSFNSLVGKNTPLSIST